MFQFRAFVIYFSTMFIGILQEPLPIPDGNFDVNSDLTDHLFATSQSCRTLWTMGRWQCALAVRLLSEV